jgi:hypothetical protein
VYLFIEPSSEQQLPFRMLFQPAGDAVFYRACEADDFRGLVAALLNDPDYETAPVADRLQSRIRMAEDLVLLNKLKDRHLRVSEGEATNAINVHTDQEFIRSLETIGFLSLATEGLSQ